MKIKNCINENWKFRKLPKNITNGIWENVNLPHTWNDADGCDGKKGEGEYAEGYYRGMAEYRKTYYFDSKHFANKEIFLEFEGANTITFVWVNETFIGMHEGGYSAFRFDITKHVLLNENTIITVKVNNAPTDYIAPVGDQGDFTKMGGIYRNVNIIAVEKVHIDFMDHGSSGIYITPKNITDKSADVDVLVKIANDTARDETVIVALQINGKYIETKAGITANSRSQAFMTLQIKNPILWNGIKSPYLYHANIMLICHGVICDEHSLNFGIRSYRIDAEQGFILNGAYTDLRGTNYHQDSYENGWAMTNAQRERDYNITREMGCNAVRMAHYQHDSYEYELCDQLGISVWSEIGIVNKMSTDESNAHILSEQFKKNAKQQLTEMILQNYNHPSILFWGITNELHQMSDTIFDFYEELTALAKSLDHTRLITCADNQGWGRFLSLPTDLIGYNLYFGWYQSENGKGDADELGHWLDICHTEKTKLPLCLSEYGGGGAISQHKDHINWLCDIEPSGKSHYENYQSELHEKLWQQLSVRSYVWGKFIWCMFDFASDGRNEGDTKGQNDKGLCTRKREPKDAYYFYKSVWNDAPMVHITEKRFEKRPFQVPEIKVYSNADKVELFVNDISAGVVSKVTLDPICSNVFIWKNISIRCNTENRITAVASFADGEIISDTTKWFGI